MHMRMQDAVLTDARVFRGRRLSETAGKRLLPNNSALIVRKYVITSISNHVWIQLGSEVRIQYSSNVF